MNSGHLPTGRGVQGGPGPGGHMPSGPGPSPGHRRGGGRPPYPGHYHQPHPSQPHQHQHQHAPPHVGQPMYPSYINPYANPYAFVGPPHFPHPNGVMPNDYMAYQQQQHQHQQLNPYARSPPTMQQHYVPMGPNSMAPAFTPRPATQQSPAPVIVSSPYHIPPPQPPPPQQQPPVVVSTSYGPPIPLPHQPDNPAAFAPIPPQTPSSTHSPQAIPTPLSPVSTNLKEQFAPVAMATPQPAPMAVIAPATPVAETSAPDAPAVSAVPAADSPRCVKTVRQPVEPESPFRAPLPWQSHPDEPFPTKTTRRSKKKRTLLVDAQDVQIPAKFREATQQQGEPSQDDRVSISQSEPHDSDVEPQTPIPTEHSQVTEGTPNATSSTTPQLSHDVETSPAATPTPKKSVKATSSRTAIPAVPVLPVIPKVGPKDTTVPSKPSAASASKPEPSGRTPASAPATTPAPETATAVEGVSPETEQVDVPKNTAPKLWTGLFSKTSQPAAGTSASHQGPNGTVTADGAATNSTSGSAFSKSNASSMAEALRSYRVGNAEKIAFFEPRGLVNTGNMCYMNSVLQVLVFCVPFYDFLDQASKKAAHSFKSETPLIDAMIMFMREYKIIDSAVSVEQLRRRLKSEELEQYGEAFTPEFVYNAFKPLARFASMRRGHQQDAEEFLGFLLEALNDECAHVMRTASDSSTVSAANSSLPTPTPSVSSDVGDSAGWLEVGPKQRAAVTRSSGHASTFSPVNRIFGGQLRSVLRIPGRKDSVTLQPFQQLPLDIGSPQVRNVLDALRGLTKPETLHGNFDSPRGKDVPASKQVFIESLPPVLILHLKRFEFDAQGNGTVKIWKKVGYPLELDIPREVFSRQKRNNVLAEGSGLPKYRLTAVVYHHGKHANGGHYTVDVLRQDGREWIRLDDTVIRRIRSEDVAEAGAEEDSPKPQDMARKRSNEGATGSGSTNRFAGMGDDYAGENEDGWKQVCAPVNGGSKKWSSVVNGASTPASNNTTPTGSRSKQVKDNFKDNKVAYLLFYQRV